MERRKFIGAGAAALAVLATPKWLRAQACAATQPDIYGYGPYYLENAPKRTRIASATEKGEKLSVAGKVTNCSGPIGGVKLELWHATDSGCYIHPSMACDEKRGTDAQARLWGQILTDSQGRFAFDTVKPGRYLNGDRYRPSHIHFRITHPGASGTAPVDLVTQLYFKGDEYIKGDDAADHPSAANRIIPLTKEATGLLKGTFNIQLPSLPTGIQGRDNLSSPALAAFDVSVHHMGRRMLFMLPAVPEGQQVEMTLFAADGTFIQRVSQRLRPLELATQWLPKGRYQVELQWHAGNGIRKESVAVNL